jgi:hypothetical protein
LKKNSELFYLLVVIGVGALVLKKIPTISRIYTVDPGFVHVINHVIAKLLPFFG